MENLEKTGVLVTGLLLNVYEKEYEGKVSKKIDLHVDGQRQYITVKIPDALSYDEKKLEKGKLLTVQVRFSVFQGSTYFEAVRI